MLNSKSTTVLLGTQFTMKMQTGRDRAPASHYRTGLVENRDTQATQAWLLIKCPLDACYQSVVPERSLS